jgi:CheY-like chemotaxis protein
MKRILIVDDEPDIVSYLEMILQDNGFETETAGNGNEALDKARKNRPDLVTLDISMPEASGTRFYKELRTDPSTRTIPVFIVTAVTGLGGDAGVHRHRRHGIGGGRDGLRTVHQQSKARPPAGRLLPQAHQAG